jgi:hypothetical protein
MCLQNFQKHGNIKRSSENTQLVATPTNLATSLHFLNKKRTGSLHFKITYVTFKGQVKYDL